MSSPPRLTAILVVLVVLALIACGGIFGIGYVGYQVASRNGDPIAERLLARTDIDKITREVRKHRLEELTISYSPASRYGKALKRYWLALSSAKKKEQQVWGNSYLSALIRPSSLSDHANLPGLRNQVLRMKAATHEFFEVHLAEDDTLHKEYSRCFGLIARYKDGGKAEARRKALVKLAGSFDKMFSAVDDCLRNATEITLTKIPGRKDYKATGQTADVFNKSYADAQALIKATDAEELEYNRAGLDATP